MSHYILSQRIMIFNFLATVAHSFKKIKSSHSRSLNLGLKFSPVSVIYPNMFHLVPVRCPYERPLSQKMTFGICFCHPMRNFVFMPITAVFHRMKWSPSPAPHKPTKRTVSPIKPALSSNDMYQMIVSDTFAEVMRCFEYQILDTFGLDMTKK